MLVSFLNMKLRDKYDTPENLCRGLDLDTDEFNRYLAERNVEWFPEGNRYVIG